MEQISKLINELTGIPSNIQTKIIASILVIIVLWIVRLLIQKIFIKNIEDLHLRYKRRKAATYSFFFVGIILLVLIWFEGFQSLAIYLGFVSAGLAIALKDPVVNFFGWLFIISNRPFDVGDRIQIDEHIGDVVGTGIFEFSVIEVGNWVDADQSTGRLIHIPNGLLFTKPIANYTKEFRYLWKEIPVLITFESNWKKAKKILKEVALKNGERPLANEDPRPKRASKKFLIIYSKLGSTVYTSVRESGVLLTIRCLYKPRQGRELEQRIWEDILSEFKKNDDITLAYPTQRLYSEYFDHKQKK